MNEEILEVTDDSRPFYTRPNGKMGLYIEVYDATAENPKKFGSEQFFLMSIKDDLGEYLNDYDLVKAKGLMEKKNICKGVILEKFERDLVLTVSFDNTDALESLWKIYETKKLTALVQEMFVDAAMMKKLGVLKLTLQARLWEDEYSDCKMELLRRSGDRISIKKCYNVIALLKRIKGAQEQLQSLIMNIRDEELEFDRSLGDFILEVKQIIPDNLTSMNSLKEFLTNYKMARGTTFKEKAENIEQYLNLLNKLREVLDVIEKTMLYPLAQIPAICETAEQRQLKPKITEHLTESLKILKPEQNLQVIQNKEWEIKILFRERNLFLGLVSLVPVSVERIVDLDHLVDEYIMLFPEKLKL